MHKGSPLSNTVIKNTTDAPTTEMSLSARLKGIWYNIIIYYNNVVITTDTNTRYILVIIIEHISIYPSNLMK